MLLLLAYGGNDCGLYCVINNNNNKIGETENKNNMQREAIKSGSR
jgi:hypothetical protein